MTQRTSSHRIATRVPWPALALALALSLPWAGAWLAGCSQKSTDDPGQSTAEAPAPLVPANTANTANQTAPALDTPASAAAGEPASPSVEPVPEPEPEPAPVPGQDFIAEAAMLYRVVACAGDGEIPGHLDAKVVSRHCALLDERKEQYRARYVGRAKDFIAGLRPSGLPHVVVYPFGGGDLISALVAFPDAIEITTLSLEHGGDPRRVRDLARPALSSSLAAIRGQIGGMLSVSNNTSKNLSSSHQNLLPAQLSSFLIALAVHDYTPTRVRYFTLEDDGSVHYLEEAEIATMQDQRARKLKGDWTQPNFSPAFSNVEIEFRPRGSGPDMPVRIHRHLAANLGDKSLAENPAVMRHLEARGRIAAMTKAASYLLWRTDFATIRDYLLGNMVWMLSDSTGVPPFYARRAGMKQTTLGRFTSSFLEAPEQHNEAFRKLWASQPYRALPFRFGYVDSESRPHLLITEPAATAKPIRSPERSPGPDAKKTASPPSNTAN